MAYNPDAESHPSPIEVGELYDAVQGWATGSGTLTLGNPDSPPPQKPHGVDFGQNMFYGLQTARAGSTLAIGSEHPLAAYPPTWRARYTDLTYLHDDMPDLTEVLGLGAAFDVLYHAPYIPYDGDAVNPPELGTRPNSPDCAIVLHGPLVPGVKKRLYKLTPNPDRADYARGTRTDVYTDGSVRREETGLLPDIARTEWERLMRIAGSAGTLFTYDHPIFQED